MTWLAAAGWGALGAAALLLGAWCALRLRPPTKAVGLIMGFGAGTLLGAISYELVPAGSLDMGSVGAFAIGAVVFFTADRAMTGRHRQSGAESKSIVLGALLDGVPESLVLGMGLAAGGKVSVAFLAAVFLSNLPEALGATAGMRSVGQSSRLIYGIWSGIVVASGVCAALGYWLLEALPNADNGYVEAFAAGAVLTMLASSMIPEAVREGRRLTGLVVTLGFAVAGVLALFE
ncbi:MAG: ZIP family zinc transporter [Corynebacteriales bacterium]|nr:ZIP family zinc transporter [Mycobacteriales bacterium]